MKYTRVVSRSLIIVSIFLFPFKVFCQTNEDIEKMIDSEADGLRNGSGLVNNYHFDSSNEKHFLDYVKKYQRDNNARVYFMVQRIRLLIGIGSKDTLIRQEVVEDFVKDFSNPDESIYQYAINRLVVFRQRDFSRKASKMLADVFTQRYQDHNFILICGTAQVKELIPSLRKLAADFDRTKEGWYQTTAWYASLALARLGDSAKIDNMITAVEIELKPSLRLVVLLRQLAYTRNQDCIRLLRKYLGSTELFDAYDRGQPSSGIEYRQYAVSFLAEYMDDFPVKYKEVVSHLYTKEEIETARAFLQKKK